MSAKIIDGNAVARKIRAECRERVQRVVSQSRSPPGLAVIVVGDDPASRVYVKSAPARTPASNRSASTILPM